jgi:hypothetical protein
VRLHGVVQYNKALRDRNKKYDICYYMETSLRPYGDHGDVTSFHDVLVGDCLRPDCAFSEFFTLLLRFHVALAAFTLR